MTDKFCREILSLPINPYLTESEVNYVIKKIKEFFEYKR
jgi:dTDP-4-amino-4,6-dideoxygalactose transaminase